MKCVGSRVEFMNKFIKKVGNGCDSFLWHDPWIRARISLREEQPRLFALEVKKVCTIAERLRHSTLGIQFDWECRRALFSWEEELVRALEERIRGGVSFSLGEDVWSWEGGALDSYSTKEGYSLLGLW